VVSLFETRISWGLPKVYEDYAVKFQAKCCLLEGAVEVENMGIT
jgi:hypothetical protein